MSERPAFYQQLSHAWQVQQSMLCVGLDPILDRLPPVFQNSQSGLDDYCRAIVEATADYVCAFKPQAAHFGAAGAEDQLASLIAFIHERYPHIPVILDAKRGDIGSTAALYAKEAYERYSADAVTLSPYLGFESLEPYLAYENRGVIVLCRTSNADSAWLQQHPVEDPLFLRIAKAAKERNHNHNMMLVAGATYMEELRRIRNAVGDMPLLVPGIGAQGGDLAGVMDCATDSKGAGLVINASRAILYPLAELPADPDKIFTAAAQKAKSYSEQMRPKGCPKTTASA